MRSVEAWVLGYALNSLWQVPLIFAAAWSITCLLQQIGRAVGAEHRVWVGALLLEAVLSGCKLPVGELWHWLWSWNAHAASGQIQVVLGPGVVRAGSLWRLQPELLTAIAVLYSWSVLYFAARVAWSFGRTYATRRFAEPVTLQGSQARIWESSSQVFGQGRFALAVSDEVTGPVTVGARHATMLVPAALLARVGGADFAAVVAHEFAHMRRRDFLKNLAYEVLVLPVAYHPALRLTRTRVAESREMICDAMAADAVAGTEKYARSLLRVAALLVQAKPPRMSLAIGIIDANTFERRIMKLTKKQVEIKGARRILMAAACVMIGVTVCGSALALRMEPAAAQSASEQPTPARPQGPARISGGVMAANNLTKVNPVYPADAKEQKIQGAVVLKAIVAKNGQIENLQVVSGPEKLRAPSLDAVRQWTYKPYLLNGVPVEVETTITVTYSLAK